MVASLVTLRRSLSVELSVRWRFSPISNTCDGRYDLPHLLIRFSRTSPTYRLSFPSRLQRAAPTNPLSRSITASVVSLLLLLLLLLPLATSFHTFPHCLSTRVTSTLNFAIPPKYQKMVNEAESSTEATKQRSLRLVDNGFGTAASLVAGITSFVALVRIPPLSPS